MDRMKYPDAPPTDKQMAYLKELHMGSDLINPPKTRKEASEMIDQAIEDLESAGGPDDHVMYGD